MDIKSIIQDILLNATKLKDKYTVYNNATAAWACIFSQSDDEYQELLNQAKKLGNIHKETSSGPILVLNKTIARTVKVLKIRKPDPEKPERGDADFTIANYDTFKGEITGKDNFQIIPKDDFEMVELTEPGAAVRVYFSNPSIEEQYKEVM